MTKKSIECHAQLLEKPSEETLLYKIIPSEYVFDTLQKGYLHFTRVDKYQDDKNRLEVIFDKKGEVTAVKINDQMVKVEYSDVFEKNDHRFYSIDLNNDGHKDYAYNSSIGMKNKYFYYFIYNPITKKFTLSSVVPKLEEKEKEKFIGTEYDGIEKEERRFVIKDYELHEIKK